MRASVRVAVNYLGKVKTTIQMLAIALLLALPPSMDNLLVVVGYVLIYVAAVMTLWSMVIYLMAAWPTIRTGLHKRN